MFVVDDIVLKVLEMVCMMMEHAAVCVVHSCLVFLVECVFYEV